MPLLVQHDHRHLRREAREVVGLLDGLVARAQHVDLLALEHLGVAGGAVGHAVAGELLLAGYAQHARLRAQVQQDAARLEVAAPLRLHEEVPVVQLLDAGDRGALELVGGEGERVGLELLHEPDAGVADRARVVAYLARLVDAPAVASLLDEERLAFGPPGVDGGRKPSGAPAYDDHVVRLSHCSPPDPSSRLRVCMPWPSAPSRTRPSRSRPQPASGDRSSR